VASQEGWKHRPWGAPSLPVVSVADMPGKVPACRECTPGIIFLASRTDWFDFTRYTAMITRKSHFGTNKDAGEASLPQRGMQGIFAKIRCLVPQGRGIQPRRPCW
jgi:hypothetical protein